MIELYHDSSSYSHFLQVLAKQFKGKVSNGYLHLPAMIGEGILWAKELPCGISVMYADCKFREDIVFNRLAINDERYILLFHDVADAPDDIAVAPGAFNMLKEMVLLTNAGVTNKYYIPANARIKSFRLMFKKEHLTAHLNELLITQAFEQYFANFNEKGGVKPLNFDYRVILGDIMKEKIEQPLMLNFLQNRSLLLLETFIRKIATSKVRVFTKQFNDSELLRLMRVESMLVRDYSETPPNIQYLSRVSAMSPTKLKSDFKQLYGMPIYEYYQKNRMQRAKSLLLEGDYSIKEVGNKVGYTNLSHFAGSFKKEFGVLPSQFISADAFT